jgi:hypothetical protein
MTPKTPIVQLIMLGAGAVRAVGDIGIEEAGPGSSAEPGAD